MYIVTGGATYGLGINRKNIISTEVMTASESSWGWKYVGKLPTAALGITGISVNNQFFVTGRY